jgi:DNA-binding MarR family transcriptional regulator
VSSEGAEAFIERFSAVKKRITALAAQAYAQAGVGALQAKLVRRIGRGITSQAELARVTDSDPPLVGRAIQTLISRGLVRRSRSVEDRREYVLALTPAGRRLFDRVTALRDELGDRIVAGLDARDLRDFERIARKLLDSTG